MVQFDRDLPSRTPWRGRVPTPGRLCSSAVRHHTRCRTGPKRSCLTRVAARSRAHHTMPIPAAAVRTDLEPKDSECLDRHPAAGSHTPGGFHRFLPLATSPNADRRGEFHLPVRFTGCVINPAFGTSVSCRRVQLTGVGHYHLGTKTRACQLHQDRVAPGRCRPRAPTDPYVPALAHLMWSTT